MSIRAYGRKIVVTPIESEAQSESGLYVIQDEMSKKVMYATVESVGPDVKHDLSPGDVVCFDYWAGTEYKSNVIVDDEVVLAIVPAE